jgi:hypothetical protein
MNQHDPRSRKLTWLAGLFLAVCLLIVAGIGANVFAQEGGGPQAPASFPGMLSYQGVVKVDGQPFSGNGYFKFAIVNVASGNGTDYWANDGTTSGEPSSYVTLSVSNGLFDVYLGDTGIMSQALDSSVFANDPTYLRVWFSQSSGGPFVALDPNQRIVGVGYAYNTSRLGGQESDYYRNATNINYGTLNPAFYSAYMDLSLEGYVDDEFGDLAKNNGTLQPFLNADQLDGQSGSYYRNASNLTCGTISNGCFSAYSDLSTEGYLGNGTGDLAQNNGTLQTNLNADRLDNMHGSDYRDASNLNAGTLSTSLYSAYSDLVNESKIGEGGSQVAAGDHDHMGQSWSSSSGDGLEISTSSSLGYAFKGEATGDYGLGVWALAGSGTQAYGVWAESDSTNGGGVYGIANASSGNAYGVYGGSSSSSGHGGHFVTPNTTNSSEVALWAGTFYGNIIEGWETNSSGVGSDRRFRVTWSGDVYADGTYYGAGGVSAGSADFAEMLSPANEALEAGDVLAIDEQGKVVMSDQPYQKTIIGVYSTKPGFIAGNEVDEDGNPLDADKVPVAVVGVVPVKASLENGAIHPGDLLVASSTPGRAMKAGEDAAIGTVIGKALESLEEGQGVIQMLVMLQ